jgi:endonuclease/exonuclease/phosphatase family metal-dependent hydrolase
MRSVRAVAIRAAVVGAAAAGAAVARLRLRGGALAVALVAVAGVVAPSPPEEPAPRYKVWHWNVAGSTKHGGSTDTGLVAAAVASIEANDPDFVSFNELCRTQYDALRDRLGGGPGRWTPAADYARFAETRAAGTGICRGEAFGNAIFSRHELGTSRTYPLPRDFTEQERTDSRGRVEERNLLCAPLARTPRMTFCTTHITGSNRRLPDPETSAKVNTQQLAAVADVLDGFAAEHRSYLVAGDFNAQPGYPRMHRLLATHTELDSADRRHCPGYGEWTALPDPDAGDAKPSDCAENGYQAKIDLILVRKPGAPARPLFHTADSMAIPATCRIPSGLCSDHRALVGSAAVRVASG